MCCLYEQFRKTSGRKVPIFYSVNFDSGLIQNNTASFIENKSPCLAARASKLRKNKHHTFLDAFFLTFS